MMYKIGVVGEKDIVTAFLALGITIKPVENSGEAVKAVNNMAKDGYGLIFVTETMAQNMKETIERYKSEMLPGIILIPGVQGSLGIGLEAIKDNVEKAVGVDILTKKEG
nr:MULTISPECIES: V-type ATP synthase subunit F [Tissierellales]